jgi:hypothetical protein
MTSPRPTRNKPASRRKSAKAICAADDMPVAEPYFPVESVPGTGTMVVGMRLSLERLPRQFRGRNGGQNLMNWLLAVLHGPAPEGPESLRESSMHVWFYGLDPQTTASLEYRDFCAYWRGTDFSSVYLFFSVRKDQPSFWSWLESAMVAVRLEPEVIMTPRNIPAGSMPLLGLDRGRIVAYVQYFSEDDLVGPVPVYVVPVLRPHSFAYSALRVDVDAVVREALSGRCRMRRPSLPLPTADDGPPARVELRRPRVVV